jgi:thiol-disulfide isomerase/thioredoxin
MSKAARIKAARRQTPPPIGKHQPLAARSIWLATAGVAAVIAIVVTVLLVTRPAPQAPPAATPSAADLNAPAALVQAAARVGFHPNVEPGVGTIENKPASGVQPSSGPSLLPVGTKAPAFSLTTPEGGAVSLDHLRGKAVLLEFFATWCPHCAAEAPHLQRLYRSLPKKDVAFVSVNADGEDAASVYAYHRYFGLTFPGLLDPGNQPGSFTSPGGAGPTTQAYGVESFPTFYVLDRKGRITWRSDGEQPDALLRSQLERAAAATGA